MVYIRRGQDRLPSSTPPARIAGERRRFGGDLAVGAGKAPGDLGEMDGHESQNLNRREITTRTKAVGRYDPRGGPARDDARSGD
jgi:hypothetical protein